MGINLMEDKPAPRFAQGIDLIDSGKCPINAVSPIACMFCTFGHLTECHWPQSCSEAKCSHYNPEEYDQWFNDLGNPSNPGDTNGQ